MICFLSLEYKQHSEFVKRFIGFEYININLSLFNFISKQLEQMSFKRTDSITQEVVVRQNKNKQTESNKDHDRSVYSEQVQMPPIARSSSLLDDSANKSSIRRRFKMPEAIIQSLKKGQLQNSGIKSEDPKKSKLGSIIKSKIKTQKQCQICDLEIKDKEKMGFTDCEHKFQFCQSCLHHYVIYKVKMFEEVYCPHDGCQSLIDVNSVFYKNLPAQIQKNYHKMHLFYQTSKDPSLKLCPRQNCDGVIKIVENMPIVCNKCEIIFCGKCFFQLHDGNCDQNQVDFFQNNLHYRQCGKCKFVIEKNQGCNHMTCRCGYQFCYICGGVWSAAHLCNQPIGPNGQILPPPPPQPNCCDCFEDTCGCFGLILKSILKIFLIILFVTFNILYFFTTQFLVIIGILILTIFAGMFGFSMEFACECDEWYLTLLMIILFPISMIIGIGKAFGEIFCDAVPEIMGGACSRLCDGLGDICDI